MQQDLTTRIGEINALLGRGTEYEGKLCFEGRVRIDGRFRGSIHSEDMLILGEGADVDGDLHVGKLIVRGGTLRGRVFAAQLVELFAPARVHADIHTPLFFLDRGVHFDGRCTMAGQPVEPTSMETGAAFISSSGTVEAVAPIASETSADAESDAGSDDDDLARASDSALPDGETGAADEAGGVDKPRPRRRRSRKKSGETDV